jgi:hypothetical protein
MRAAEYFRPALFFCLLATIHLFFLHELDSVLKIEPVVFWPLAGLAAQSMAFLLFSISGNPGYMPQQTLTTTGNIVKKIYR